MRAACHGRILPGAADARARGTPHAARLVRQPTWLTMLSEALVESCSTKKLNTRRRPHGHRGRPGRRLARRLHRPSRRPAGTDLRLVRGGRRRRSRSTTRRTRSTSRRQSADYLDISDVRCQVIGRHLFDFIDGWGGRCRSRATTSSSSRHRDADEWQQRYPEAPYTFCTDGIEDAVRRGRPSTPATAPCSSAPARSAAHRLASASRAPVRRSVLASSGPSTPGVVLRAARRTEVPCGSTSHRPRPRAATGTRTVGGAGRERGACT